MLFLDAACGARAACEALACGRACAARSAAPPLLRPPPPLPAALATRRVPSTRAHQRRSCRGLWQGWGGAPLWRWRWQSTTRSLPRARASCFHGAPGGWWGVGGVRHWWSQSTTCFAAASAATPLETCSPCLFSVKPPFPPSLHLPPASGARTRTAASAMPPATRSPRRARWPHCAAAWWRWRRPTSTRRRSALLGRYTRLAPTTAVSWCVGRQCAVRGVGAGRTVAAFWAACGPASSILLLARPLVHTPPTAVQTAQGYGTSDSGCNPSPRLVDSLKGRELVALSAAKHHTRAWGALEAEWPALSGHQSTSISRPASGFLAVAKFKHCTTAALPAAPPAELPPPPPPATAPAVVLAADGGVWTFGHKVVTPRPVQLAGSRDTRCAGPGAAPTASSSSQPQPAPAAASASSSGSGGELRFHRGQGEVSRPFAVAIAAGAAESGALTRSGVVLTWASEVPAAQVGARGGVAHPQRG